MGARLVCPSCSSTDTRLHCVASNEACDLLVCRACKSYGTRDGKRWVAEQRPKT